MAFLAPILLAFAAAPVAAGDGDMTWQRRELRAEAPQGYLAVVVLSPAQEGARTAALVGEGEGLTIEIDSREWRVRRGDDVIRRGEAAAEGTRRFFAKRTARQFLLGVDDRWVYGCDVTKPEGKPAVRLGVGSGYAPATFRLVAREPVRFADDFPDPVPQAGTWVPLKGHWVLSSLSYADKSANPAELAAVFGNLEDAASAGRTRTREIGVGIRFDRRYARVMGVAVDSPAARAGIREDDYIRSVDGQAVSSASDAEARLQGEVGEAVKIAVEREGTRQEYELVRASVVWGMSHRHVPIQPSTPGDTALIAAGQDYWTDYRFACATQLRGVGAFGLVFAMLGPEDYHVFRWLSADKVLKGGGRWQIVRVRGGKEHVVSEKEGGFFPHDFYALSVAIEGDSPGGVRATGAVDGTAVIEAADDAMVPGKLGFWAEEPGVVSFDDVVAGEPERKEVRGSANAYQRSDPVMRAWADPAYSWLYAGLGQQWWHRSDFPGDVTLTAPVTAGSSVELALSADRGEESSGYRFTIAADGSATRLSRATAIVGEKPLGGVKPTQVTFSRKGKAVRVLLDGKAWLAYDDAEPLKGSAVRIKGVIARDVVVDCPNVVDYYFNGMPVEWHVGGGSWEVMNRWVCNPTWSFFGGRSDGLLSVWSKRRLEGDCFLDLHVGLMMFGLGGYTNMRDVGLTICGDGRNVAKGYTAIVGANQNALTALFRNGKLVAQTSDYSARLPRQNMSAAGGELYTQHRGWIHMKLIRQAGRVRLYIWDRLAIDYADPEPLPGGRAAIWSVDNGMLLAKVRLAADRVSQPEPILRSHRTFGDAVLTNDCLGVQASVRADGSTYEIANVTGGGPFGIALRPRVFSAVERPRISFDVKLTEDVKVDLYLHCHGTLYRVALTGSPYGIGPCETLGAFEGVKADGEWHRASFDLHKALKLRHPLDGLLMVWEPLLANHSNHQYLLAGFGGNPAGATYWLRNVKLEESGEEAKVTRRPADSGK